MNQDPTRQSSPGYRSIAANLRPQYSQSNRRASSAPVANGTPRPRLASSSPSDWSTSTPAEQQRAASDPDGDNTDGNQASTAVLRAVDDGILLRRRHSPNITVGAKKVLAFAREINVDPGHFITIP